MKRYKNCTRFIKVCRWLRYKPLAALIATYATFYWVCTGAKVPKFVTSRAGTIRFIWTCNLSMADFEMGNYVTLHEAITELKERVNENTKMANAD